MSFLIIAILILTYFLLAVGSLTQMNKAAIAMFGGTVGWVIYICYGTDFVMSQHPSDYFSFLSGVVPTSVTVKEYIASNVFIKYVGRAAEIVLFLLATMTTVEILDNNGSFDFLKTLLRTRSSRKFLWVLSIVTLVLSANLNNLTATIMMLTIMHGIVENRRQRMVLGGAIVLSATYGGMLTVIGEPLQLFIWNKGAVTATNYSMSLLLPGLVAWALPIYLLGRMLPERVETAWITLPYRGNDTNLNPWQRVLLLLVGIGGLWFIPTFHDITKLSPFLGALCVLSVLWIVNEIFNLRLMDVGKMIERRVPRQLQYGVIQMMLFVIGMMLAVAVARETGVLGEVSSWCDNHLNSVWLIGILAGAVSCVVDTFASAMTFCSFHNVGVGDYAQNGAFWKVIAFCTTVGGNVLGIGSMSGLAFLKMERMHVGWYFRNIGWKALVGGIAGLALLALTMYLQN